MKILVVDDEQAILRLCAEVLQSVGYEVFTASSGKEALRRLSEGWDIVLTDLMMPGDVDGNEVARRVRALGNSDVILMTGYPGLDSAVEAIKAGAFDYLIKPFTADTLLTAVKRCVEKRRLSADLVREKSLRAELDRAYIELAKMEQVRETFGQFVTPEVAEFVLAYPQDFWKRGERRVVSILFADVRSFTSFTARVPPEDAVNALNQVFECIIDAVQAEHGVLNKFIGDGLMALFGAPVPSSDPAASSARAALRAQDAVDALAESRRKQGLQPLRIGIGVNTGEVVVGCVGTKERAEFSVFGYPVNVAARLEEMAGAGQVLLGAETVRLLRDRLAVRELGRLSLAGITEPTLAYELVRSAVSADEDVSKSER